MGRAPGVRGPLASRQIRHARPPCRRGVREGGTMDLQSMRVPACVPVGVLATITMDAAMVAAGRLGESASTSDRYGPDVIGRWVTDSVRGRWRHGNITREPGRRGELALGLLTHYVTGIVLTQVYLLTPRRGTGDGDTSERRRSASRRRPGDVPRRRRSGPRRRRAATTRTSAIRRLGSSRRAVRSAAEMRLTIRVSHRGGLAGVAGDELFGGEPPCPRAIPPPGAALAARCASPHRGGRQRSGVAQW